MNPAAPELLDDLVEDHPLGRMPAAVAQLPPEVRRYVLPFEHLVTVVVRGDQLVIALNEREEYGPGCVRVIRLTSGEEVWNTSL